MMHGSLIQESLCLIVMQDKRSGNNICELKINYEQTVSDSQNEFLDYKICVQLGS